MKKVIHLIGIIVLFAVSEVHAKGFTLSLAVERQIQTILKDMTLAEKVGQMTQANRETATAEDVKTYFLGSILNGGGGAPGKNTHDDWIEMLKQYQQAAGSTRSGIPIIYGTDAVHGHNNAYGATIFPHNVGLGAMRNPGLASRIARITALETASTGVHWTFAPTLCTARDDRWGRAYECFGEDPEIATSYAGPIVKALQGDILSKHTTRGSHVIATAKHWVADGGTSYGTGDHSYAIDRGNAIMSMEELGRIHMKPYLPAIEAGIGTVMISFSSVNGVKMHQHKYLITDVLKGELGFNGFTISDWEGISEIPAKDRKEQVALAVNAGIDMMMEPNNWKATITDLIAAVEAGEVPISRIDDAVTRILRVKIKSGLFENPVSKFAQSKEAKNLLGAEEHRKVARRAVMESAVLLKNENKVLPIKKDAKVFVAGVHADDIGLQCGGWTISWQGKAGDITPGKTILDGIQRLSSRSVTYNQEGFGAQGHDVAVVVVGEQPYAEGDGDYRPAPCEKCQPMSLAQEQLAMIERVKSSGIPTVVVMVSGRPLMIEEQLKDWDALLAAWLPGSEGDGIADVLFGEFAPKGLLPVTWPKNMKQIPINVGDKDYDPLFKYGFGLTYAD